MMRYQRVSPDYLPATNGTGRKPSLRTCKEDEAENGRIPSYSSTNHEDKSLRARSTPGSGSATPSTTTIAAEHHHYPRFSASPPHSLHPETHTVASAAHSAIPAHKTPNGHHEINSNGVGLPGGGDVLLQWGHNKRSRGSRAERQAASATAGDESSVHSRQVTRVQRRAAEKRAAGVMPPPCGSYTRGANLRPCIPVRDTLGAVLRSAEERSAIPCRSEKRAHPSPQDKARKMDTAGSRPNGCGAGGTSSTNPESKPLSDQETGGSGSGSGVVVATEKLNLEQFEWPRIYISLSRKEKEDDFLAMKGTKLPQRPKKRAKNIDKTIQYCFPGLWLSDLTRGRYEVREKKCVKKKRRGLKGMESVDSDSE